MNSKSLAKILNLREGEEIEKFLRKYPLCFLPKSLLAALIIILPFFFLFFLFSFGISGVAGFSLITVLGAVYALRIFISWYGNLSVITNYRVIDVDQRGFFDKTVSGVNYDKVQDISFRKKGVWETVFDYGTVQLQLVGSNTRLQLRQIRRPQEIQELLLTLAEKYKPKEEETETRNTERVEETWNKMKEFSPEELKAVKGKIDSKFEEREEAFREILGEEEE